MAKRKLKTPVVINKNKFLLPKMEWFSVDDATGEGFYVRELSGQALLEVKELADKLQGQTIGESLDLLALMVVRGACDKDGHPIFTDEDIPLLLDKALVLMNVSQKVMQLSNMTMSGEATNNLKNAPPDFSFTELPTNSVSL